MHSRKQQRSPEGQPRSKAAGERKESSKWSAILALITLLGVFLYVVFVFDSNGASKSLDLAVVPPEDILRFSTEYGDIRIILRPDRAPNAVAHFKKLVDLNFFDGCGFYRAEKGFVIQGGAQMKDGTSKDSPLPDLTFEYGLPNIRGTIALARGDSIDSANADYFINLVDNSESLGPNGDNPGYTAFGEVAVGMDLLDQFSDHPTTDQGGLLMLVDLIEIVMTLEA